MAVRGYYYNADSPTDQEHAYNGQDMNIHNAPFFKQGVAVGQLGVTAVDGAMAVQVDGGTKTGFAFLNWHTIHNSTVMEITLSGSNGTLPRIDRIVVRNDETEKRASILVLEGTYSSNPVAPELTNNDTIQELCLAEVYVAAGAVEITQANITDTRADTTICGFIASQFEDVDFSMFQKQFNAWFAQEKKAIEKDHKEFVEEYEEMTQDFMDDEAAKWEKWFAEKQSQLSEDVAGKLQLQIDGLLEKVHNMAMKLHIESLLETITAAVKLTLTNTTTGTVQTKEVTESGLGFYITEAGTYTLEADNESVMVTPKVLEVDHTDLMTNVTITLREGTNLAYIGNYIGTYLVKESEE